MTYRSPSGYSAGNEDLLQCCYLTCGFYLSRMSISLKQKEAISYCDGGFLEEAAVSPTEQRGSERWLSWRTLRQSTGLKWKLSQTCTGDGVVYVIEGKQQESQK